MTTQDTKGCRETKSYPKCKKCEEELPPLREVDAEGNICAWGECEKCKDTKGVLEKVKKLMVLHEKSTKGKWKVEDYTRVFKGQWEICSCEWQDNDEESEYNAKLISQLHNLFPQIAQSYEELYRDNQKLKEALEDYVESCKGFNHKPNCYCLPAVEALNQLSE